MIAVSIVEAINRTVETIFTFSCVVQGSIICDGSHLQTKCSLLNCQVSSGQTVKENGKLFDEECLFR